MSEIATELNGQFMKDYNAWYKEAINDYVKARNEDDSSSQHQLLVAPIPDRKIKCGFLHKIGFNVKNWKHRFFVAYNESKNFNIHYYEDESLTKEKGYINCCG